MTSSPDITGRLLHRALWAPVVMLGLGGGTALAQQTGTGPIDLYAPPVVVDEGDRLMAAQPVDHDLITSGLRRLDSVPREAGAPWFETDWSVELRGSYVQSSEGTEFVTRVTPEFELSQETPAGEFTFETGAVFDLYRGGNPRLAGASIGAEQEIALDANSDLTLAGELSFSQDSIHDLEVYSGVLETPLEVEAEAEVELDRQFGKLGVTATLEGSRYLMSDALLDSGVQSNLDDKYWQGGGMLRAGYAVTPLLTPFAEVGAFYTLFDAAPAGSAIALHGWDYEFTTGIQANLRDEVTATASVGLELRQFDDASLSDVTTTFYELDVGYEPTDTVNIGAAGSIDVDSDDPTRGQLASVTYAGSVNLAYELNDWLTLRGSLGGELEEPRVGPLRELSTNAGLGADFELSDNSIVSLDYLYDQSHEITEPVEHAHEFALGVKFSR